ncbi:hypothetical protein [Vibrio jasicida]|uniref:hypothetical protein n=1 Tax=Vibrio jasicida TaxID=766224 RepID=UPI0005F07652|nr:hypothetical protein [Vibrio jasicida]
MRHIYCALSTGLLLAGCAAPEYTGQGEYFELHNINVIERDLSTFKPTQMVSTATTNRQTTSPSKRRLEESLYDLPSSSNTKPKQKLAKTNTKPKVKTPLAVVPQFEVRHEERYQAALTRWIRAAGYPNVAWSMKDAHLAKMDGINDKPLRFKGSLKQAVSELSHHLNVPLQVTMDKKMKVAGVYDFAGKARITHVTGKSIKAVTKGVVENYGLRWDDGDGLSRSWLAPNDYRFGADYYLLTAQDDIVTALSTVLEEFPVRSSIVESTGQVIIQEEL